LPEGDKRFKCVEYPILSQEAWRAAVVVTSATTVRPQSEGTFAPPFFLKGVANDRGAGILFFQPTRSQINYEMTYFKLKNK